MSKIILTEKEKELINNLGHSLYTVDYLEHWINRNDNVFVNAPAALNAMGAKGYYDAIRHMIRTESV